MPARLSLSHRLGRSLSRFRRRQAGYMLVESVLVVPFLLWGYIALYSYWDAYRNMTNLQKAAYAMSDLISREQRPINAAYIAGMRNTINAMLGSDQVARIRVTSIMWDEQDDRFEVEWSNSPSGLSPLTTGGLTTLLDRIPEMSDGRTAIIFEATLDYEPSLSLGFGELEEVGVITFQEFIVTPPRYAPRVVLQ